MNYNMQGMTKMIPELFAMLKSAVVEIKKEHEVLMLNETSDKYFAYKIEENSSTSEHVLRMSEYYNHLNQVGVNLPDKILIDRVL